MFTTAPRGIKPNHSAQCSDSYGCSHKSGKDPSPIHDKRIADIEFEDTKGLIETVPTIVFTEADTAKTTEI